MYCVMCRANDESVVHAERCLHISKEELIKIAASERHAQNSWQVLTEKYKKEVTFWQGKFSLLKQENNRLRNKLRGLEK